MEVYVCRGCERPFLPIDIREDDDEERCPRCGTPVESSRRKEAFDQFSAGMNTSHHQRRVLDEYPEPLGYLLSDLIATNERYWLKSEKHRRRTYGAEQVLETGLTTNQQVWADDLREKLEGDDDE